MFKIVTILATCAAVVTANAINTASITKKNIGTSDISPLGVVSPIGRCGGVGTPIQLRISECEGYCQFVPGRLYNCEKDFMPSSPAQYLTLKIEICMNAGFCMVIMVTQLPNSSVQPGFIYTAKYSIVPNDILAGQTVEIRGYLTNQNELLEICVSAIVDILGIDTTPPPTGTTPAPTSTTPVPTTTTPAPTSTTPAPTTTTPAPTTPAPTTTTPAPTTTTAAPTIPTTEPTTNTPSTTTT